MTWTSSGDLDEAVQHVLGGFADLALHPDVAEGLNALATDQPHYGYAGTDTDEAPTKGLTLNALR